jgi:transcriptional regulator with XRE-family HTH domain
VMVSRETNRAEKTGAAPDPRRSDGDSEIMEDLKRVVGGRLREYREDRGLSRRDIARLVGVSIQAVEQWENARSLPSTAMMATISHRLGISKAWLLGEDTTTPIPDRLKLRQWVSTHEWRRSSDQEEVITALPFACPLRDDPGPHKALWIIYRSGLARVVCPRCGQYQVG